MSFYSNVSSLTEYNGTLYEFYIKLIFTCYKTSRIQDLKNIWRCKASHLQQTSHGFRHSFMCWCPTRSMY